MTHHDPGSKKTPGPVIKVKLRHDTLKLRQNVTQVMTGAVSGKAAQTCLKSKILIPMNGLPHSQFHKGYG